MKLASSYLKAPVTPGVEAAPAVTPLPEPVIHCGLESYDLSIVPSMEEVAISMSESEATLNQIQEDLGHVSRLEDQAEGLSTLADVSERVESAEPSTLALIDVAAELATVGTDVNSDEHLVGGLEAFAGLSVGTEAIDNMREMAKKFIDALVAILKRIWESAKQFYKELTDLLKICVRQASDVELQAKEANGKSASADKVELPQRIAAQLVLRNKAARSGSDLVGYVNSHKKATVVVLDDMATELVKFSSAYSKALYSMSRSTPSSALEAVNSYFDSTVNEIVKKIDAKPTTEQPRFPANTKAYWLDSAMGSVDFVLLVPEEAMQGKELAAARKLTTVAFKAFPSNPNVTVETSIKPMTPQEAAMVADCVKEICGMIEQFRTAVVPKLKDNSDSMKAKYVETGSWGTKDSASWNMAESAENTAWKELGRYNTVFANLANSGTGRFVSQTLKTLMAMNKVCKLSLDLYV